MSFAAELLTADHSLLLLIDLQSKLAPAIHNNAEVEQHCRWHVEVARELAEPVLATEQYPHNPNGSPAGITSLTTTDGRVTIMMPHPERVFRAVANSWQPDGWQ